MLIRLLLDALVQFGLLVFMEFAKFGVLVLPGSGAPWGDLPNSFGPYTTCYNRFVRWRRAGVWAKIMNALAGAHDAAVQMIDTSIVRVHQHGACITRN